MHFDQLLQNVSQNNNETIQFPANWCQGRTAFGGLTAAMLVQAMRHQVCDTLRLLSLQCNFIAPLIADTNFQIHTEILREGKNTIQVLAKAIQNDQVCILMHACFGKARVSDIRVDISEKMNLTPVNPKNIISHQPGITPEFFQHLSLSPQIGNMPFSGGKQSELTGWMKFKETPKNLSEAHIIALTDAWPPTLLQMFNKFAPASSISWSMDFVETPELAADEWLGYQAKCQHSKNGYGIEDGTIWSQSGKLIALTRQTVAIFI